ncbi:hypothetical protein [Rhizobium beringeri]|uniref:hypothetical protein n=1 Tax=Rhizobium beringeri TaxID=3019934 RepID=UPI002E11D715|nr:hypothetical protein U8P69_32960 [Rhizobium beringeri]
MNLNDDDEHLIETLFRNGTITVVGVVLSFSLRLPYAVGQQSNTVETCRPADVGRHNYRHRLSAALPRFTFANVITEKSRLRQGKPAISEWRDHHWVWRFSGDPH